MGSRYPPRAVMAGLVPATHAATLRCSWHLPAM